MFENANNMKGCSKAIYTESLVPQFADNPLIEALPPIQNMKDLYKGLACPIPYDVSVRQLDRSIRKECISGLFYFFQPWGVHIEIAERIGRAIRNGYVNRNPLVPEFNSELNQLSNCVHNRDSTFQGFRSTNPGASGFSIVGVSGSGKTSTINRILETLYPQKIMHEEYHGQSFHHLQIAWMKITCPFDGSVKGLCIKFFEAFDRITGDSTFKRFAESKASTVDTMLTQMVLLARRHSLGALVIDEIQNIDMAKSGGKDRMLNFMADLMDSLGIPIIVVGIPAAIQALSGSFMTARRSTGQQGTVKMDALKYGSDEWELFVNAMWKYQWTNVETKLTDEMSELINEFSRGIVSLAVQLYAWTQELAIENGHYEKDETIKPSLFCEVAQSERFCILKDQIAVMDNGSYEVRKSKSRNPVVTVAPRQKQDKSLSDPSIEHWDKDPEHAAEKLIQDGLMLTKDDSF